MKRMERENNSVSKESNYSLSEKMPDQKIVTTESKMLKPWHRTLLISLATLLLTLGLIIIWGKRQLNRFTTQAQISPQELKQTLLRGWRSSPQATNQVKNILILGLDQLEGRGDSPALTDTMILISLDLKSAQIRTLSLPRDLWHQAYQTKINALYAYGQQRNPDQPTQFPSEVISEMTGLPIHHTLTVSMEELAIMVDLLGGVEVKIEQTFTDNEFPRPEVDVTKINDPELLYERVSFQAGTEVMDGQRALKFMRSRHGDNQQNTDLSRGYRQQAVIQGLVNKLTQPSTWAQLETMGQLYRFYLNNFSAALPATELVATAKALWPVRAGLSLKFGHLSVYPQDPEGTIEHPAQSDYDGQWVYIIRDQERFKQKIQSILLED